jgi:conjugal transfer/entry exclusion protein
MARKTKTDTRNLARRVLAIDDMTSGRLMRLITAIETLSDLKKDHKKIEARVEVMYDKHAVATMTAQQTAAADDRERKMENLLESIEDDMNDADEEVQAAADDLAYFV